MDDIFHIIIIIRIERGKNYEEKSNACNSFHTDSSAVSYSIWRPHAIWNLAGMLGNQPAVDKVNGMPHWR